MSTGIDILPSVSLQLACRSSQSHESYFHLRVAALFIILVGSTLGALVPVLLSRRANAQSGARNVPLAWLDFAKHFGSGIILGTAFIHLLAPGIEALGNPCLSEGWRKYPYALGLCLSSILAIYVVEVVTMRYGAGQHPELDVQLDSSSSAQFPFSDANVFPAEQIEEIQLAEASSQAIQTVEEVKSAANHHICANIIGLAILEFGAILHSVLIGLTLAVDPKFKVLFAVLVTHQVFEGLGIGSRLATVRFPVRYVHLPVIGAVVFGMSTPLGMAVGLAMRSWYNANDAGALVISGVLDSLSAGILMYTALVELLGREILFNEKLMKGPTLKLSLAVVWMFLGCCIMALLGKWV
ncbi:ZIP-like iron-zinc transporter [Mycena alexandri]|uniref:ZIP-like iron-zinc transporter n=1 Tax=Mycena alexandri TaxID=1745969 RepID=A0AAD6X6X5_9AGAR|nr:ZIP-like iron-zinc transporter [Mycena alexandri]